MSKKKIFKNKKTFKKIHNIYKGLKENATKNIRNRVFITVLRESLLKQLDNGAFEPRNFKREKVKKKYCYRFEGTWNIM